MVFGISKNPKIFRIQRVNIGRRNGIRPQKRHKKSRKPCKNKAFGMVPVAGVEPARHRWQRILSPPRLPIPTHRQVYFDETASKRPWKNEVGQEVDFEKTCYSIFKNPYISRVSGSRVEKRQS